MTFAQAAPRARFRFGDALQGAFDAIFANVRVFALLALTLYAVPTFVAAVAFGPPGANSGLILGSGLLKGVVGLATSAILQGSLVRGVVTHLNGAKPRFSDCLRAGLSAAAPLVGIGLLFGMVAGVGLVLFIAPGLFFIAMWGLAAPVVVIERGRGVFGAFSRSADLTQGHRWAVLGVLVIMFVLACVAVFIGGAAVAMVSGVTMFASGGATATAGMFMGWGYLVFVSAITAVTGALGAIFTNTAPAAIYYELRRSKEGAAPAQLAAVFD